MKILILIVDDSLIFRKVLEEGLSGEPDIEVIGSVRNGLKALDFIRSRRPDLITLDVEMPDMDGMETLDAIQALNRETPDMPPIGVIMLSAHTRKGADITIKALEAGAFDFITKPRTDSLEESRAILRRQLLVKIRYFTGKRFSFARSAPPIQAIPAIQAISTEPLPAPAGAVEAVAVGVSTGGPKALATLMPALCEGLRAPIFIVQHMPAGFTRSLAASLDKKCAHTVVEAEHNRTVKARHVYIAPGDRHMLLRNPENGPATIINRQPPENGSRPSADVLFRSAATVFGPRLVALILTGMGSDGTKGAAAIKRAGGRVIAQDNATAVVWGMPGSAAAAGHVDAVLPLDRIADAVVRLAGG